MCIFEETSVFGLRTGELLVRTWIWLGPRLESLEQALRMRRHSCGCGLVGRCCHANCQIRVNDLGKGVFANACCGIL